MENKIKVITDNADLSRMAQNLLNRFNSYAGTNLSMSDVKAVYNMVVNFIREVREQRASDRQFIIQLKLNEINVCYGQVEKSNYTFEQVQYFMEKAEECTRDIVKLLNFRILK